MDWSINRLGRLMGIFLVLSLAAAPAWGQDWVRAANKPGFPINLWGPPVEESSVAVADVTGDGRLEMFLCDTGGKIWSFDCYGRQRWVYDSGRIIKASPSIGDVTGNGSPNLVVGLGADVNNEEPGGFLCLDAVNGTRMWERETVDIYGGGEGTAFNGIPDGVFASANLTDLNDDGQLEIIVTAWDHRLYLLNGRNATVFNSNWPFDFWDSSWASPVVADVDRDGNPEVIVGADLTQSYIEWSFPGGRMWVFDLYAQMKEGWPVHTDQTFYSSPAVGDINNDGWLEIVSGTGCYYEGKGHLVHAWNHSGEELPGWPVAVGGYVFSSPALADVNEDGYLDVVVGCYDGRVYCISHDGTILWATMLVTVNGESDGTQDSRFHIRGSPVVADINGDGHLEILIAFAWEVVALDWQGNQLTGPDGYGYVCDWSVFSSPTVADIDRDGKLEIITAAGYGGGTGGLWVWSTDSPATAERPWPTFHRDVRRTGLYRDDGELFESQRSSSRRWRRPTDFSPQEPTGLIKSPDPVRGGQKVRAGEFHPR